MNRAAAGCLSLVFAIDELATSSNNIHIYDLTTENHYFAADVGNMIVHSTDSVFFTFNLKDPIRGQS